jgi:hypothetical protein
MPQHGSRVHHHGGSVHTKRTFRIESSRVKGKMRVLVSEFGFRFRGRSTNRAGPPRTSPKCLRRASRSPIPPRPRASDRNFGIHSHASSHPEQQNHTNPVATCTLSALSFALSLDQQLCLIILGGKGFDPKGVGIHSPLKALSFGSLWLRSTKKNLRSWHSWHEPRPSRSLGEFAFS